MAEKNTPRGESAEIDRVVEVARALNLDVGDVQRSGSEANFVGVRSADLLLSRRIDSRTWFLQAEPEKPRDPADVYKGSDKSLIKRVDAVLDALEIPRDEVADIEVLQERQRTAKVEKGDKVSLGREQAAGKVLRVQRAVSDQPVWSSSIVLRPGKDGRILFLQAHWPDIPEAVVDEACELEYRIRQGWCPPAREGATPASSTAGVIHSPAIGLVMDAFAAIRVIYDPWNPRVGRKLMLHLDRHGRSVPRPRIADMPPERDLERKLPAEPLAD